MHTVVCTVQGRSVCATFQRDGIRFVSLVKAPWGPTTSIIKAGKGKYKKSVEVENEDKTTEVRKREE